MHTILISLKYLSTILGQNKKIKQKLLNVKMCFHIDHRKLYVLELQVLKCVFLKAFPWTVTLLLYKIHSSLQMKEITTNEKEGTRRVGKYMQVGKYNENDVCNCIHSRIAISNL